MEGNQNKQMEASKQANGIVQVNKTIIGSKQTNKQTNKQSLTARDAEQLDNVIVLECVHGANFPHQVFLDSLHVVLLHGRDLDRNLLGLLSDPLC